MLPTFSDKTQINRAALTACEFKRLTVVELCCGRAKIIGSKPEIVQKEGLAVKVLALEAAGL